MDDLISKNELINQIKLANNRSSLGETVNGFNLSGLEIISIIMDMPIAYSVDNIVDQLVRYKNIMKTNMENTGYDGMAAEYYRGRKTAAIDFLEIINGSVN